MKDAGNETPAVTVHKDFGGSRQSSRSGLELFPTKRKNASTPVRMGNWSGLRGWKVSDLEVIEDKVWLVVVAVLLCNIPGG